MSEATREGYALVGKSVTLKGLTDQSLNGSSGLCEGCDERKQRSDLMRRFYEAFDTESDPSIAIDIVHQMMDEGIGADAYVMSSLARLYRRRARPEDLTRAVEILRSSILEGERMPADMEPTRYEEQYNLVMVLTEIQQPNSQSPSLKASLEEALNVALSMSEQGEDQRECKILALQQVYSTLDESPAGAVHTLHTLIEKACRALIMLKPNDAAWNLSLGAALCIVGKLEEGLPFYQVAKELADKPVSQGGLSASQCNNLEKAIVATEKQLSGELPRVGVLSYANGQRSALFDTRGVDLGIWK